MRRVAVLLAVSLAAGVAGAQDPTPDDRVPIPAMIDSWYRVDQNKEHCGYFHETLTTTTMRQYRYEYFVESEYQYNQTSASGDELSYIINESLTAELEEDFDLFKLDYTQTSSGTKLTIELRTYPESDERLVKVTLPGDPPVVREYKFATSESIHFYLNPMIYRLRQSGALVQPTRQREKVLIPDQEDLVSVSYNAGALASREVLGKPAKVSEVRVEGWARDPLMPLQRLWVDKYGRIVEAESADKGMGMILVKDELSARGTTRRGISQRGRRDPFVKATTPGVAGKGPKGDTVKGAGDKDPTKDFKKFEAAQFDAALAETQALLVKLQAEVAAGQNEDARRTYLMILQNYRGLYPLVQGDVLKRPAVEKVREDAERLYPGVKKQLEIALGKLDRINDLYLNDNLEGIDREVVELKAMKELPEFWRHEQGTSEMEQAIRSAESKRAQSLARIELGKKVLILTGTITATEVVQDVVKLDVYVGGTRFQLAEPVTVRRTVTHAVINDEPYREGEIVSREGVKIMKIHRHAVEVEYKGEVRQVVLRR